MTSRWIPPWRHARHRRVLIQTVVLALVLGACVVLAANVAANLRAHGIRTGFGFLAQRAGFQISPSLIPFSEDDSFGRALLAGLLNTVLVTVLAIPLASIAGLAIGLGAGARARLVRGWRGFTWIPCGTSRR